MVLPNNETICALATASGIGGIAVIRVSGDKAFQFADAVLLHKRPCNSYRGYTVHRAIVVDGTDKVDDVLVSIFHGPKSFTGEDVVEISCHGGTIPVAKIVSLLIHAGCRAARPGEFTQRAYLNGKIDLAQAEAVCDMINSKTDAAYRQAQMQSQGALSKRVDVLRAGLLGVLARIEASIDFPEDVGELDTALCRRDLSQILVQLRQLLATADHGILLRQGAQVVLVGSPNAGKSSLLNALLRHDRAIVTSTPGTTRDTLEETINLDGVAIRLWDTAGMRDTDDVVEAIGVARSKQAMMTADLVVLVVDSAVGLSAGDQKIIDEIPTSRLLIAWNKTDLKPSGDLRVSARFGNGIEDLEQAIGEKLYGSVPSTEIDQGSLTQVHHRLAVERAASSITNALETVDAGLPADLISVDVRLALTSLGEVTGETANEDVISEIFSKFCIGK